MNKKVNLFFVGFPKCGTTVLYDYFSEVKDVSPLKVKEPSYFSKDLIEQEFKKFNKNNYFKITNFKDYQSLISKNINSKYIADFSTSYSFSKIAPYEIFSYNSESKIILMFREPLSLMKSIHNQNLKSGYESKKSFYKALKLKRESIFENKLDYYSYIQYEDILKRYLEIFPKKNIKILFYEDFKKNNQRIVNEICDFLQIKKFKINRIKKNSSVQVRFHNLYIKLIKINKILQINKILSKKNSKKILSFFQTNTPVQSLNNEDILIKKKLKEKVKKFEKLLKKNKLISNEKNLTSLWNYKDF